MKKFKTLLLVTTILFSASLTPIESAPFNESINTNNIDANIGQETKLQGNTEQLNGFFEALSNTKNRNVRIAHFGDSMIWGDIISAELREKFQKKFGGNGQGLLSICADDISIKTTTIHKFSDDWDWASLFTRNAQRYPIGICGTVATPSNSSWVEYIGGRSSSSSKRFNLVRIFYSNTNSNSNIKYTLSNGDSGTLELGSSSNNVEEKQLSLIESVTSIKMNFNNCKDAFFYGISLENEPGLFIDNIALRGNSGVSITDIDEDVFKKMSDMLNYKLVILSFGINVAEAGKTDYRWYIKRMERVIKYIRKCMPDVGIILVGTGDRSVKKGSQLISEPVLPYLIKAQMEIAKEANVAYWNMFEAMGGENSMKRFVEASPPLAYKDYTHFTPQGGEVIADLLFNAIMDLYSN